MSLRPGLSLGNDRRRLPGSTTGFTPHNVAAVTRWLRFNETSGSYSAVPDQKGGANATQGTAINQPSGTTLGGLPAASFDGSNDWLAEPINSANNGATVRGVWFRFRPATVSGLHTLIGAENIAGGSDNSFCLQQNGADLFIDIYHSTFVARRLTVTGVFSVGTTRSYSWEQDLGQSAEADKCTIWVDGAKVTGSFANSAGAPGGQPASMVVTTGAYAFGVQNISTNLRPLSGVFGRNILWLAGSGGVSGGGLLSAADRAKIEAFEP